MRPWRSRPRGRSSRALEEDFALTTNDVDEALGWPLRRDVSDGREHAIRLLDELSAGERPRWTLVDAVWTPSSAAAVSEDKGNSS
jgi:hypothetical protein